MQLAGRSLLPRRTGVRLPSVRHVQAPSGQPKTLAVGQPELYVKMAAKRAHLTALTQPAQEGATLGRIGLSAFTRPQCVVARLRFRRLGVLKSVLGEPASQRNLLAPARVRGSGWISSACGERPSYRPRA
jgi:hypothetical protein